ncbi:MAG TPA: tRNA 2-thiouridine(34) synthase MnmA [Candidatus Saccharimonadales bacterium]|nr:tRNA 2-thiouridine(34) synthase MnmA [Candidatus Saccharimonadales bacterium]
MSRSVYVAMSGGVDSSVAAALLIKQGYSVTGVYMKNWSQDLPGHHCPWQEDYQDAKRVAVKLGIKLKLYDFQKQYRKKVVDYMISEYKLGRTPNPDIMCNQEVKFKLFLQTALSEGADFIATGHYSIVSDNHLLTGVDVNKDQSYFLCRVDKKALKKTIFPIGKYSKPKIRAMAKSMDLHTADKKDSQGICFVGKVGIREFLSQYVNTKPGNIIDQHGAIVGQHSGAIYYTIGQRQGLDVGGGLPYYVTSKNMNKNQVFVTTNLNDSDLWSDQLNLTDFHWIDPIKSPYPKNLSIRTRYRAPLIPVKKIKKTGNNWKLDLDSEVRAITPGQSAVLYQGDQVLGGGIVI